LRRGCRLMWWSLRPRTPVSRMKMSSARSGYSPADANKYDEIGAGAPLISGVANGKYAAASVPSSSRNGTSHIQNFTGGGGPLPCPPGISRIEPGWAARVDRSRHCLQSRFPGIFQMGRSPATLRELDALRQQLDKGNPLIRAKSYGLSAASR
jgi:hypothetical protein